MLDEYQKEYLKNLNKELAYINKHGQTAKEIEAEEKGIEKELEERELDPRLINSIKQLPVNIAAVKTYLTIVAEKQ